MGWATFWATFLQTHLVPPDSISLPLYLSQTQVEDFVGGRLSERSIESLVGKKSGKNFVLLPVIFEIRTV
jgi:hypothetical protein